METDFKKHEKSCFPPKTLSTISPIICNKCKAPFFTTADFRNHKLSCRPRVPMEEPQPKQNEIKEPVLIKDSQPKDIEVKEPISIKDSQHLENEVKEPEEKGKLDSRPGPAEGLQKLWRQRYFFQ